MSACLADEGQGPCLDGIDRMEEKLMHIERLQRELDEKRAALLDRIDSLKADLEVV
ncbi:hypothetical protein N6L24_02680 [Cognatishimia sp. SS12]|uniref:hypothetical protein n=1 Tax=Cognatishimia sp. SS12 TaxID=2979465 RepID=UPI00232A8A03|nr:hypothetical protein [Cognatishimia sp. SS12]MDC0737175.1 hypothetical protein [Cognatishimia sp. SS12]